MKLKPDRAALRLRRIPANTVVHTPTEAEAKELLGILHEKYNYTLSYESLIKNNRCYSDPSVLCFCFGQDGDTGHCYRAYFEREGYTILSFAEFKKQYCEEEEPRPKFNKGDMVVYNGKPYTVEAVTNMGEYYLYSIDTQECDHLAALPASDLELYAEAETKPTEDMEHNESHNLSQNSTNCDKPQELDLVELLKGHEGETFFCTACGNVIFSEILTIGHLKPLHFNAGEIHCYTYPTGRSYKDGLPIIYPSRALYEQYPLDPYTAWMKWQEEQKKKIALDVNLRTYDAPDFGEALYFRTPSERGKCIEEIKAIIEKYSKE